MFADVRWGIIGCGDVTEVKSGPALQEAQGSELVAVMRRTASLAEDYARRHGVARWSNDADAILYADDIDAVYIATQPNTHCEYVVRAAAAGKAVLVEKPMAPTVGECREMIAACREGGVPLWVAYYRRALPRFEAIRELIADGVIGAVRSVTLQRAQLTPPDSGQAAGGFGGYFLGAACHALDYLDHLFGPIVDVGAMGPSPGEHPAADDTIVANLQFSSGVVGSASWCFRSAVDLDTTTIVGADGTISFPIMKFGPIRITRGREVDEILVADPPHVHQPLLQTIVDELHGVGRCASTGTTAARTTGIMARILADIS